MALLWAHGVQDFVGFCSKVRKESSLPSQTTFPVALIPYPISIPHRQLLNQCPEAMCSLPSCKTTLSVARRISRSF
jgi:hypothetical protein